MTSNNQSIFQAEREKSGIDADKLAEVVFGSRKRLDNFLKILKIVQDKMELTPDIFEFSRFDLMTEVIKKTVKFRSEYKINHLTGDFSAEIASGPPTHMTGSVGLMMAAHLINVMGNEGQQKAWLPSIINNVWNTCYLQTELSHGTDFNSVKTTVTFDAKTQEFVVNTPSLDAMKWWPGDLSLFSSHGLLMGQLYSNGVCYGVAPFFIQIRDTETHKLLPGLECGDIGPKLGYGSKDNGYLR